MLSSAFKTLFFVLALVALSVNAAPTPRSLIKDADGVDRNRSRVLKKAKNNKKGGNDSTSAPVSAEPVTRQLKSDKSKGGEKSKKAKSDKSKKDKSKLKKSDKADKADKSDKSKKAKSDKS